MNCLTVPGVHPGSPSRPRGQIQVRLRPADTVSCSTELMRRVRRFQLAQYQCLLVKYAKDTRYSSSGVSTHDKCVPGAGGHPSSAGLPGLACPAHSLPAHRSTMEALPAGLLQDVYQEALGAAVIGIDEGQFFPDIVEFCETMANAGKTVIVAALDGTFQRKAFGSILNLVPLAESVVKLNAVCMECFCEASYTKRLGAEREVEVIGGADKYHSVCRACYFRKRPQQAGPENKEN
ncbi:KITH protein, partial [Mystacornis crossleyi]|nr:KITH protein [Mystacornis crossleyi]